MFGFASRYLCFQVPITMFLGSNIYDIAPQDHRFQKHVQIAFFLLSLWRWWGNLSLLTRKSSSRGEAAELSGCSFSWSKKQKNYLLNPLYCFFFVSLQSIITDSRKRYLLSKIPWVQGGDVTSWEKTSVCCYSELLWNVGNFKISNRKNKSQAPVRFAWAWLIRFGRYPTTSEHGWEIVHAFLL